MKETRYGTGEVDWCLTHARVYLPVKPVGQEQAWVRITKGTALAGEGIVDDTPKRSNIKLGTPIKFAGGTSGGVRPKFVRRLHKSNQKAALKGAVAIQLAGAMQAKWPGKPAKPVPTVAQRVIDLSHVTIGQLRCGA